MMEKPIDLIANEIYSLSEVMQKYCEYHEPLNAEISHLSFCIIYLQSLAKELISKF